MTLAIILLHAAAIAGWLTTSFRDTMAKHAATIATAIADEANEPWRQAAARGSFREG